MGYNDTSGCREGKVLPTTICPTPIQGRAMINMAIPTRCRYPAEINMDSRRGTRLVVLTTAAAGVGDNERSRRRRGRNTAELNHNRNRTLD